jgi:hypothetical protein
MLQECKEWLTAIALVTAAFGTPFLLYAMGLIK